MALLRLVVVAVVVDIYQTQPQAQPVQEELVAGETAETTQLGQGAQ